ncbi:MAG: amidohydrolase family protein [Tatlockia sp.]|jgi:predicted amidohydrolase YtcJ
MNKWLADTLVFILHLYDRALLNRKALEAVGITRDSKDPPGGHIARDKKGNPTGLLIAEPNAMIHYATLAKGPKLPLAQQMNSTRHFMRELNRPTMPEKMEQELSAVVRFLVEQRWPFRLHATYNETITRALNVFESIHKDTPFQGLRWFFDHAETVDERNLERIKKLGGGVEIQHRMAFQGEYFVARYGKEAAQLTPPIRKMLEMEIPVGAGTVATRVASYNPFVSCIKGQRFAL